MTATDVRNAFGGLTLCCLDVMSVSEVRFIAEERDYDRRLNDDALRQDVVLSPV
jgi:hypothetical protein